MKKYTVYIVYDNNAEDAIYYENPEELTGMDYKTESFDNESDAEHFIDGLFFGCDERAPAGKAVLRDWNEMDNKFIEALLSE